MKVGIFDRTNKQYKKETADLLIENFPHAYADCAALEVNHIFEKERVVIAAIREEHLIGIAGAIPQYGTTGWELHPLAVKKEYQFQGIGTLLMQELEKEIIKRNGITIYLGTDDEFGQTSLSNTNLYLDTYQKIEEIKNLNNHPYEFYQKVGYQIVGVIPDANGIGKPDIWMAKRVGK